MSEVANYWINMLHLEKHPEGGYFLETFKSDKVLSLPEYSGARIMYSAIYYLLVGEQFSKFHIMKTDEMWHFYTGSSLMLHIIESDGRLSEFMLGKNF